jgi:hypothetical protein
LVTPPTKFDIYAEKIELRQDNVRSLPYIGDARGKSQCIYWDISLPGLLYRAKFRFQNPMRQNYRHVCAIQELLDFLSPDAILPIVVFTGDAEFKTTIPDGVFTLAGFLAFLERHTTEVMSANRVQFCVGRLETARLSITNATDVDHVQQLRRRYGSDE